MASNKVSPAINSALLIMIICLTTQNTVLAHDEAEGENIEFLLQSETLLSVSEGYNNSQHSPAHVDKLTYLPNDRVLDDILKAESLYSTDENIHLRYKRDDNLGSGDVCNNDNGGCDQICNNTDESESVICSCNDGFTLNSDNTTCSVQDTLELFSFSTDESQLRGDDVTSPSIESEVGIPFGSNRYQQVYVGSNGIISFDTRYNSYTPRIGSRNNFVCPYWGDINQRYGGNIYYRVYNEINSFQMRQYSLHIAEYGGVSNFEANWALQVTYDRVAPYQGSSAQRVTFQVVLVSNGLDTYALYLYKDRAMNWFERRGRVFIGHNDNGIFNNILYSGTEASFEIDRFRGNTGLRGFWIFKIGSAPSASQLCLNWYYRNRNHFTQRTIRRLPRCPCSLFRLWFDWRWRYSGFGNGVVCYRIRPSWRFWPSSKECCYDSFGRNMMFGQQAGSALAYNQRFFRQQHYTEDTLARRHCCQQSNRYCYLYNWLRPAGFCTFRSPFRIFWVFGDPHINTLDGKTFVFNGLGEYTLMRTTTEDFVLQGRTDRAETANGTLSNATIFSAFAVRDDNGTTFQVELDQNKTGLIIYGNGRDFTSSFNEISDFTYESGGALSISRNGTKVTAVFSSGISLTVTPGLKLLTISCTVPEDYMNSTRGLMGNFNNDVNDDFALPNGTVLSPNITEREIYRDFGQQWMINASESVFNYPPRKGPADFSFPEFVPVFLDEQPDDVKAQAYAVCGGQTNLACIYDFIATGNQALAAETLTSNDDAESTNSENANTTPEINGTTILNATVGETSVISVIGTDSEDGDGVTYIVVDQPVSNFSFNNQTNYASWTPSDANPVNISFVVQDTNNLQSPPLEVQVRLCDGCNSNGNCDHSRTRQALDEADNPSFQLVACNCSRGWEGDSCNVDIDGCADDPCLVGQNCTDRPAANHTVTNIGYDCSPCPDGYSEQGEPPKCEDVNECNSTNNCDQVCKNTDGSYTCSCNSGYRKQGFGTCNDINECDERISGCNQLCTNTDGNFNCSCRSGYILNADGKNCTSNTTICQSSNCTQGCSAGDSGSTVCFCRIGYILNADNVTCDDEDECSRNPTPCSQECSNNVGSFECSCFPGYNLAQDRKTCEECPIFTYGVGCSKTCQCGTNGIECDKVRGCICKNGWRGENCTTDIDECTEGTFNCTADTICDNTDGSYQCLCQSGYQKLNGICQDINECNDDSINDCEQTCLNTNGSFSCGCTSGYRTSDVNIKQCVDIDECSSEAHGCQQFCDNVEGGYNCRCEFGFQLAGDRKTCLKVEDVCATFINLNCSYACNVSLSGETANCYCQSGYRLANDQQTCLDINECESNVTNRCSHTCDNKIGSYSCSCPVGKKLENDERTCLDCDNSHWGENCVNECGCGIGASGCDKITGCVCKNGWQGDKCQQDVDECSTVGICPQLSTCRNTPGNYSCDCREGYDLISNTCQDIDECSSSQLNTCDSFCNNTVGSFICSCRSGFVLRNGSCADIDECENGIDNCEHTCRNEAGSFSCECRNGFRISDDDASRCVSTGGINCSLSCENCEILNNGSSRCFCTRGFKLAADNLNCTDIDECSVNPCTDGNCTQGGPGEFTCACPAGFQLEADQVTCKECPQGTHGTDCSSTCDCYDATTASCSNVDGTCSCVDGWQGTQCDEDKDECVDTLAPDCGLQSSCLNTNGSYICKCNVGYFKSNDGCVECDDTHWGDNCQETCQCVAGHVLSCNKTDGTCNCNNQWNGSRCQTDVNECNNQTICGSQNFKCVNFDGGYRCDCQDGYTKDANGNCEDIDECVDLPCPQFETCSNTAGNYTCTCPRDSFYTVNETCTDINECDTNKGGCQQNCTNLDGSFRCECSTGYTLNSDAVNCTDINECNINNGGCEQVCNNTVGSYICSCNAGFTLNNDNKNCSDIDECKNSNMCTKDNEVCNNTIGSYECICDNGYVNISSTCQDIDECSIQNGGCQHECRNLNGTFKCECRTGYELTNDTTTCTDIDECSIQNGGCQHECSNLNGTFKCECRTGYELTNDTTTCIDIDECKNSNMCTKDNEVCNNTIGSYECICDNGYVNISSTCQDIDECSIQNGGCQHECRNLNGTFKCECRTGYELTNDTTTCTDIDECSIQNGGCQHECSNLNGTFKCECRTGYELTNDTTTCIDMDECKNSNMCTKDNEVCNNTIGSYECICDNGYKNISSTCQDMDECSIQNGGCQHECRNLNGTFKCECRTGYELTNDTTTCIDINECDTNNGGCNQVCNNTVGSYSCSCNTGFIFNNDNKTCSEAVRTNMTLEVADAFNQSFILNDKDSSPFKELVKTFTTILLEYFRNQLKKTNIVVYIFDIKPGSLVIDYEIITSKLSSDQLAIAVTRLAKGDNLTIGNQTYDVESVKVNGKPVANFSVCQLYEQFNSICGDNSVCDTDEDGVPYCR
ncbi:fibrillin-1-like isoform X3 [Patella vulgata]|uniref:fibrillin-1-like isoform X3 n=1 Tax=Patella vulgata TaxID=6465 RepID=UPI0024A9B72E|nr:fibrillin-1-like isoform X3 [Patella vulgata]